MYLTTLFSIITIHLLLLCHHNQCTASKISSLPSNEEDHYDDIATTTTLYEQITKRQWDRVRTRLKTDPDEVATLIITRTTTSKHHDNSITVKSMPLHTLLEMEWKSLKDHTTRMKESGVLKNVGQNLKKRNESKVPLDIIERTLSLHPPATRVTNHDHYLPLHLASYANLPVSTLQRLLDANPDAIKTPSVDPRVPEEGKSNLPLHCAASTPTAPDDVLSFLITAYPAAIMAPDNLGDLPLHVATIGHATPSALKILLDAGPDAERLRGESQYTALHLLCKYGGASYNLNVLKFITEAYPEALEMVDDYGLTPLQNGLKWRVLDEGGVRYMMGRDEEGVKRVTTVGKAALHLVFDQCCATRGVVGVVLEGYPEGARVRDGRGNLPLHQACWEGIDDVGIIEDLLEVYPESKAVRNNNGELPLHLALNNDDETMDEVASVLIEAYPEGVTIPDKDGNLPLHAALNRHKPASLIYDIIAAYPKAVETPSSKDNALPIHIAARVDHYDDDLFFHIIEMYPEGAKQPFEDSLPLHLACQNNRASKAVLKKLINANPDAIKVKGDASNFPLHLITARGGDNTDIVTEFLDKFPKAASQQNKQSYLPLHLAAQTHTTPHSTYEKLINTFPAAAITTDNKGNLPIHHLVKQKTINLPTLQLLLNARPDSVTTTNSHGESPLYLAIIQNNAQWNIIHALLDAAPHSDPTHLLSIRHPPNDDVPLATALMHHSPPEIVTGLLVRYPPAASMTNKRNYLPLHLAVMYHHTRDIISSLISAHPDGIKSLDDIGRTPLHIAVQVGCHEGVVEMLLEGYPEALDVVERNWGRTPLMMAESVRFKDEREKRYIVSLLKEGVDYWRKRGRGEEL